MKLRTTITAGAVAVVTTLALAGCSSGAGGMSGMDMGSSSASPSSSSSSSATNNAADVMFAQMMIAHHMQAIEMSDIVLKKTGVDPKVTAIAKKIKAAQAPEIDEMNGFLTSWGEKPVTSMSDMSGMSGMSGMAGGEMMSSADMDKLEKASGAAASPLFLTQMVQHHTSAVAMAQDEVEKGKDPEAVALAKKIVDDQTTEIATMKQLLSEL